MVVENPVKLFDPGAEVVEDLQLEFIGENTIKLLVDLPK